MAQQQEDVLMSSVSASGLRVKPDAPESASEGMLILSMAVDQKTELENPRLNEVGYLEFEWGGKTYIVQGVREKPTSGE